MKKETYEYCSKYSNLRTELQVHLALDINEKGEIIDVKDLLNFNYLKQLKMNFEFHENDFEYFEKLPELHFYQIVISENSKPVLNNKDKKAFKANLDYYKPCKLFNNEFTKYIKLNINDSVFQMILESNLNTSKLLLLTALVYNLAKYNKIFNMPQGLFETVITHKDVKKYKNWLEENVIDNVPYSNGSRYSKEGSLAERFEIKSDVILTSIITCNYSRIFDTWMERRKKSLKSKLNLENVTSILPNDPDFIKVIMEEYYIKKHVKSNKDLETSLLTIDEQIEDFLKIFNSNESQIYTNDDFGFRKHSSITRMNKIFRQTFVIDNQPLFELDLSAAQPTIMAKKAFDYFKNNQDISYLEVEDEFLLFQDYLKNDLYLSIAKYINKNIKDKSEYFSRTDVKNQLLKYMMCPRAEAYKCYPKIHIVMYDNFKFICDYLCFIQKDVHVGYKKSSMVLQKGETQIMNKLLKIIKTNEAIFTVHDAVFLDKKSIYLYKDELVNELLKNGITCSIESYNYKEIFKEI